MSAVIEELKECGGRWFLTPLDIEDLRNCHFQDFYAKSGEKLLQVLQSTLEAAWDRLRLEIPGGDLVSLVATLVRCVPSLPEVRERIKDGQSCSVDIEKVPELFAKAMTGLIYCKKLFKSSDS